jgi:hypothetical protein
LVGYWFEASDGLALMLLHRRPASKKFKHLTIAEFIMTRIETNVKRTRKAWK